MHCSASTEQGTQRRGSAPLTPRDRWQLHTVFPGARLGGAYWSFGTWPPGLWCLSPCKEQCALPPPPSREETPWPRMGSPCQPRDDEGVSWVVLGLSFDLACFAGKGIVVPSLLPPLSLVIHSHSYIWMSLPSLLSQVSSCLYIGCLLHASLGFRLPIAHDRSLSLAPVSLTGW